MTASPPDASVPEETRLDPDEWEGALTDVEGPQLVVAGPGTGKSEFLVRRAVHLVSSGIARPDELLVLTFSRRAAADLRRRILDGLGRSVASLAVSTFHSFARRLLEAHGDGEPPTLLTGPEHVALVAELLRTEDPAAWPANLRPLLSSATLADDVADFLLRCEERLIGPEPLAGLAERFPEWRALPAFVRRVRDELDRRDRIDYGSLLRSAVDLLADPARRATVADRHPFVLVDEYQDTSPAQAELLDRLTAEHRRLTVAADPYQSIYGFRGAEVENVARFPGRFSAPGRPVRRIVLTHSFRVPEEILSVAERVTAGGSLPGGAGPIVPAPHAGSVEAYVFDQASAEAEWIAAEVERLSLLDEIPLPSIAVLVRSKRTLLPELSRALGRRGIPHDVPDARLVDHPAVQLVYDLARAADADADADPFDDEHDRPVRRILLGPLHGLPIGRERELVRLRRRERLRWSEVIEHEVPGGEPLAALLREPGWATERPAIEGFFAAWDALPGFGAFVHDPDRADDRRALAAFAQALERQADRDPDVSLLDSWRMTAAEDFEATPLLEHHPSGTVGVTLTTLHQAKGLEFDVVFVADASEGVFPDLRRGVSLLGTHRLGLEDPSTFARRRLQEEMRLAYTAMTRARRRVVWTATAAGIDELQRRPSRFLVTVAGTNGPPPPPPSEDRRPITVRQVQAVLRRTLQDPAASPARRLAAAAVLAGRTGQAWDASRFAGTRSRGPDRGILPGVVRLSPTQVERYADCPRRYAFERRLSIEDATSPYLRFGGLVHAALERADRSAMDAGRPHPDRGDVGAALAEVWEEADFGSPVLDEAWRRKAVELLDRLVDEWPTDSGPAVDVERILELELDGIAWSGRADRIERTADGSVRVVDYKTSASMATREQAATSLQLGYYVLAAGADAGLATVGPVTSAELWYPKAKATDFRRSFDTDRMDEVRDTLVRLGRELASEVWEPTVGPGCARCRVRLVCPAWPEGREAYVT
jgi:superfamily I DNA/RNA helicase/RecB family exonuclease